MFYFIFLLIFYNSRRLKPAF